MASSGRHFLLVWNFSVEKEDYYKRLRVAGILTFIPLVLAAGPFSGFLLGDYLQQKFGFGRFVLLLCIGFGLLASIFETIRIIRFVLDSDKK